MKKYCTYPSIISLSLLLAACGAAEQKKNGDPVAAKPVIKDNGTRIEFPQDSVTLGFFKTETVTSGNLDAELSAPARIVATVLSSGENPAQNLVLFDNPDLTANYTALLQYVVNISQKQNIIRQKMAIVGQKEIELSRFTDLVHHGAGTGKDVTDAKTDLIAAQTDRSVAETELANEKTTIIEHEARLKLAGFDPESLLRAKAGKVWLICDVPENLVTEIREGNSCKLQFTAYPDEVFTGRIEDVGEVIDNTTRMVKLRIGLANRDNKLRAGMFANVQFGLSGAHSMSIPKSALITVQGKNYVFVPHAGGVFERKEIVIGAQVKDRIIIYSGLNESDAVVTDGAMQLKGFSFGY